VLAALAFVALLFVPRLAAQGPGGVALPADARLTASSFRGSVLLARGGEVILAKGYGLANLELEVPNTPETKFRLGSITKTFTAAAVLHLQEQGRLNVQDRISAYIPNAPDAWKNVTIHHLLTHTSGIPSYTDGPRYEEHMRDKIGRPEEMLARFRDLPLEFRPGEKFKYNNSGYFLLGLLIEQVSGEKYEDYLRRNIFEPLQMADTGYD